MTQCSEKPYHITCPRCGSPNVVKDAYARWNYDTQSWELSATFDNTICESCDYRGRTFYATKQSDLTPAQKAYIEDGSDYVIPTVSTT